MNLKKYQKEYAEALENSEEFWAKRARLYLTWGKEFTINYNGSFGKDEWFPDGQLNACYNCIDRWAVSTPDKVALIFDSNDGLTTKFTYKESLYKIYEIANVLLKILQENKKTIENSNENSNENSIKNSIKNSIENSIEN